MIGDTNDAQADPTQQALVDHYQDVMDQAAATAFLSERFEREVKASRWLGVDV